jgi:two-component system, LuxR family, response regulator FixJ
MAENNEIYIYFVDDEPKIREVVAQTLEQSEIEGLTQGQVKVICFASAAECIEQLTSHRCDLLITDLKMPGINGLELLQNVKRIAPWIPVLIITGYGDIPSAVVAMKEGAADFIEKPLATETLLHKVRLLLGEKCVHGSYLGKSLTLCEKKILAMITQGKSSREMAILLNRSVRTIEVHRSCIMSKLGVNNLAELLKRAALMRLTMMPKKRQNHIQRDENW